MSTIKSSDEHLTLNADGSSKDIKFQANGVEKASLSSAGAFTSKSLVVNGTNADLTLAASGNNISFARNSDNYITASGGSSSNLVLDGQNRIVLKHNGTEKLRVTTDGLTFNGDTASANALDDYEEGTWTPMLTDLTNNATMHSLNAGLYTKIGRVVHFSAYVRANGLGSVSGNVYISGLPFSNANTIGNHSSASTSNAENMSITADTSIHAFVGKNGTSVRLDSFDVTGGVSVLQASEFTAYGQIVIGGTYFT